MAGGVNRKENEKKTFGKEYDTYGALISNGADHRKQKRDVTLLEKGRPTRMTSQRPVPYG